MQHQYSSRARLARALSLSLALTQLKRWRVTMATRDAAAEQHIWGEVRRHSVSAAVRGLYLCGDWRTSRCGGAAALGVHRPPSADTHSHTRRARAAAAAAVSYTETRVTRCSSSGRSRANTHTHTVSVEFCVGIYDHLLILRTDIWHSDRKKINYITAKH